jgi:lantibiotic modifying enzyme
LKDPELGPQSGCMGAHDDILKAAVHSILGFIKRTVEPAEVGVAWETINYDNTPHHDPGVFNGVGGISFFLVDSFAVVADSEALSLAQGAIDWCRTFSGKHFERGLHFGKTGSALAALHKATALNEPDIPEFCLNNAAMILREPVGPVTDLVGGEASNGLYLLKLWAKSQDDAHLRGAERCAAWLEANMTRDDQGTYCPINPAGSMGFPAHTYLGVAHGIAGIAHFVACLAEATNNERWVGLARSLFDTVARYSVTARGGLNWPNFIGSETVNRCQWSHGAAGIGLTFLTAHRVLRDSRYLDIALQAAEATYAYGDFRNNLTFCTGLTGGGTLLLDAYNATGNPLWKERASDFALRCIAYKESTPFGDAWPTDAKGLYSADFDYGAAGVGHFLLRLLSDGKLALPVM